MASTTIRVSDATYAALQRLARDHDRTIADVVADAVDRYEREQALAARDAGYARIETDPVAWREWQAELKTLRGTPAGGPANDP
jgi:predicted transcriptional regulator